MHKPEVLFTVANKPDSFYMAGKYRGTGSVMKFDKRNAKLDWNVQLTKLTRVNGIATVPNNREEYFFGCG